MPRVARVKSYDSIYHVMNHSMSEFNLFRDDEDKNTFLDLLEKYCKMNHCAVLAYCLMDTHFHLHIDPQGYDISKLMHGISLKYAQYYNKKYDRQGHVFRSRFESKITASEKYMLAVSAYIHNNPGDMEGFRGKEHLYPYSSLGIYMGIREDKRGIVNTEMILGLINERDKHKAAENYMEFVMEQSKAECDLKSDVKVPGRCLGRLLVNEYRSERCLILRGDNPERVIEKVGYSLGVLSKECIHIKYKKEFEGFRSFTVFALRVLCGLNYREICRIMGNISLGGAARLCQKGYERLVEGGVYRSLYNNLVSSNLAA